MRNAAAELITLPFQTQNVRAISDEFGNAWFAAKDVCEVLDVVWNGSGITLKGIPEEWSSTMPYMGEGGKRELVFVNEPALYRLIFRSNKPKALEFANWVCGEVLPALRKNGHYGSLKVGEEVALTRAASTLLRRLVDSEDLYECQWLRTRLNRISHSLGQPLPDVSLLGEKGKQLSLLP